MLAKWDTNVRGLWPDGISPWMALKFGSGRCVHLARKFGALNGSEMTARWTARKRGPEPCKCKELNWLVCLLGIWATHQVRLAPLWDPLQNSLTYRTIACWPDEVHFILFPFWRGETILIMSHSSNRNEIQREGYLISFFLSFFSLQRQFVFWKTVLF